MNATEQELQAASRIAGYFTACVGAIFVVSVIATFLQ